MKHFFFTALAGLLALLFLTSCGAAEPKPLVNGASKDDLNSIAGVYRFESKEIEEQFLPYLKLETDGSATFYANLLSGMGTITGSYVIEQQVVKMTVEKIDFDGFAADGVKTLLFDISSDTSLLYCGTDTSADTPLGATNPYDLFRLSEE